MPQPKSSPQKPVVDSPSKETLSAPLLLDLQFLYALLCDFGADISHEVMTRSISRFVAMAHPEHHSQRKDEDRATERFKELQQILALEKGEIQKILSEAPAVRQYITQNIQREKLSSALAKIGQESALLSGIAVGREPPAAEKSKNNYFMSLLGASRAELSFVISPIVGYIEAARKASYDFASRYEDDYRKEIPQLERQAKKYGCAAISRLIEPHLRALQIEEDGSLTFYARGRKASGALVETPTNRVPVALGDSTFFFENLSKLRPEEMRQVQMAQTALRMPAGILAKVEEDMRSSVYLPAWDSLNPKREYFDSLEEEADDDSGLGYSETYPKLLITAEKGSPSDGMYYVEGLVTDVWRKNSWVARSYPPAKVTVEPSTADVFVRARGV